MIKPIHDRVAVKLKEKSNTNVTDSGLVVVGDIDGDQMRGEIIAVGPGATNSKGEITPLEVVVGETVVFASNAGTIITEDDGTKVAMIRESEIIAVLE